MNSAQGRKFYPRLFANFVEILYRSFVGEYRHATFLQQRRCLQIEENIHTQQKFSFYFVKKNPIVIYEILSVEYFLIFKHGRRLYA